MIKKTITYTDYNDDSVTETFHFHLSKDKLLDNLDLQDEFDALEEMLAGEKRELKREETKRILALVKELIKLSYGVRSEDGKKFRQGDDLYRDFADSAAYDAILFSLFENPEKALEFMAGIMPKDLMEKAREQALAEGRRVTPQDHKQKQVTQKAPETTQENVEFSDDDILAEDPVEAAQASTTVGETAESIEELEARLAAAKAARG